MDEFDASREEHQAYLAAALVGYALGIRVQDILRPGRGSIAATQARQISFYLLRTALCLSLARVARAFSRDRTTVAYACRLVEERRDDPDFDIWMEQLELGLSSVISLGDEDEEAA